MDLILLRHSNLSHGVLNEASASCMKVPVEIWVQIRKELILSAMKDSEEEYIESARCDGDRKCDECENSRGCCEMWERVYKIHNEWRTWGTPKCETCKMLVTGMLPEALFSKTRKERLNRLLASFGLKLLCQRQIRPGIIWSREFISFIPITVIEEDMSSITTEASTETANDDASQHDEDTEPFEGASAITISSTFINRIIRMEQQTRLGSKL